MKGRPIDQLVYEYMFPKPRPQDPTSFQALLQRHLVLEVRQEVHAFYGHLNTPEAKYPGLDYSHPTHRLRLSRWPWHRRLFRAFDGLRLTASEIAGLTKWEGTRWAKERYEREQGIVIRDTTADGFRDWVAPEDRPVPLPVPPPPRRAAARGFIQQTQQTTQTSGAHTSTGDPLESDDGEGELESVGVALNERLRERVAARNAGGDPSVPLDEEWEQWLKNLMESHDLPLYAEHVARLARQPASGPVSPEDLFLPRMLASARAGRWDEIPGVLHGVVGARLEDERSRGRESPLASASSASASASASSSGARSTPAAPVPSATSSTPYVTMMNPTHPRWRRTHSDLRPPSVTDVRTSAAAASVRLPPAAQAPGA